jgi:hypothetical protein
MLNDSIHLLSIRSVQVSEVIKTCSCQCSPTKEQLLESLKVPAGYRKVEPGETLEQVGMVIGVILFVVGIFTAVFLGTAVRTSMYRRYWY